MKQLFKEGWSLHAEGAKEIYGASAGPDGRKEPYYTLAKKGRHLWNYNGKARTMAASLGLTIKEAERIIKRLESMHPGVVDWHKRIRSQLFSTKTITNKFGYRIVFFDRIDEGLVGDALAWIGQGTVACVANRAWDLLEENIPQAPIIIQNHDSVVGYAELNQWPIIKPLVHEQFLKIVVPYDDPLIIPPEVKVGLKNWGQMTKEKW
jgi:DNA polymerase I-like protein with 3'-5' exonuclease and polymerase domains